MIGPWDKSLLYLLSSFQFCSAYHDVFTQFQWNKGAVCVPLDHGHREQTPAPQRAVLITDSVKIAGERAMNRAWWGHVVDDGFIPGASPAAFFLNGTIWYSSLLFIFFFFFLKAWIKRSPGSSPDIWLSSWVSEVNWTPFLSYEIVMPKHKSYPDRNLNCSKTGTIRMSFIWFLIIVKCWTKDKILCFSKKSFVPLHKINMRSLICIQVFLETILK